MKLTRRQLKNIILESLDMNLTEKQQKLISTLETPGISSEAQVPTPYHMTFTPEFLQRVLATFDNLPSNPFNGPDAKYDNPGTLVEYFIEKFGEEEYMRIREKDTFRGQTFYYLPEDHPIREEHKKLKNEYDRGAPNREYGDLVNIDTVGNVRLQIKAYNYLKDSYPNFTFGRLRPITGSRSEFRDMELQLDAGTFDYEKHLTRGDNMAAAVNRYRRAGESD